MPGWEPRRLPVLYFGFRGLRVGVRVRVLESRGSGWGLESRGWGWGCRLPVLGLTLSFRKVDVRLPEKRNLNSHGARPVH